MATTPRWLMDYLASNQADAEIGYNKGLNIKDALTGLSIVDRTLTAPPAGVNGKCYIVAASATGDWTGKDGKIACYYNNQWMFITPGEGLVAWLESEGFCIRYTSTNWVSITGECTYSARLAANQTYTTWAGILWDTDDKIHSGCFGHSTSSNKEQITLKEIGWYQIEADITFEQTGTAAYNFSEAKLYLNGADVTGSFVRAVTHFGNINMVTVHLSMLINNTSANQVLEVRVQRQTGAAALRVVAGYTRLKITRK